MVARVDGEGFVNAFGGSNRFFSTFIPLDVSETRCKGSIDWIFTFKGKLIRFVFIMALEIYSLYYSHQDLKLRVLERGLQFEWVVQ